MNYRVISADDHIDLRWLPKDLWKSRLAAAFRERGPHVEETDGGPHWFCDGKRWAPWGAYTAAQGSGAKWALEAAGVMEEDVLRPTTLELRLEDMDRDGVDATVMYGPTDPFAIDDPELRCLCYTAYNDWLHDFCAGRPERLIGVEQLSCEDAGAATRELARVAKRGARHVNVLAARATPPVYDDAWAPFWALAEETGIPIGFHLAVEVRRTRSDNGIVDAAMRGIMGAMQLMAPIVGLVVTGVLDRHPRLKLVMAESGLSWLPHMIQSLDTQYRRTKQNRLDRGSAGPALLPSEYFRRQIWATFQDDPAGMQMLPLFSEDRVMWASDYPHPASTWPNSQQVIEAQMRNVSEATRHKLLSGNARALYAL